MYIDDCVEGLVRLMASDYAEPLNLGTDRLVTINQLIDLVSDVAGKALEEAARSRRSRKAYADATATTPC